MVRVVCEISPAGHEEISVEQRHLKTGLEEWRTETRRWTTCHV